MDSRKKAVEFFELMFSKKKCLVEIPKGYSKGETGTLFYLTFYENNIPASKLASVLDVTLPRVASLINSLEQKGLVAKECDKFDKRKTVITITEEGKNVILDKKEKAINKIANIIDYLGEEDYNEYVRLTKKIGKIIEDVEKKKIQ